MRNKQMQIVVRETYVALFSTLHRNCFERMYSEIDYNLKHEERVSTTVHLLLLKKYNSKITKKQEKPQNYKDCIHICSSIPSLKYCIPKKKKYHK